MLNVFLFAPDTHNKRISAFLILLLGLVPGASWSQSGVPVTVTEVRQMATYRQVPLTGTVTSLRSASLSAAISGLVNQLNVDAGSRVEAGDVLLELDSELVTLQVQSSEARAMQQRNAMDDAGRRLREARKLAPQRSIAKSAVRDLEAELAEDEAALQQAQADAGYQRAILKRHTVRAPFAGVVSAKLTELGEWVTPGQAVLELVAIDAVRLDFPVAEDYLSAIRQGDEVSFSLNAEPGNEFPATVATVVPVTDPGARTFLLRVVPKPGGPVLKPGMSVRAVLRLPTGRDALVVPRDATLRYPDGRVVVWTIETGEGGAVAAENLVQPGVQFDGQVEILSGLSSDARVVVEGNEALQVGQAVEVRSASSRLD